MIIASNENNEYLLKFSRNEWEKLLSVKPIERITGWSAGWHKFSVKCEHIKDPFEKEVI